MIVIGDSDCQKIIEAFNSVLKVGYGEVRGIIQDGRLLDIIPSPRIRVSNAVERTTQTKRSSSDAVDKQ